MSMGIHCAEWAREAILYGGQPAAGLVNRAVNQLSLKSCNVEHWLCLQLLQAETDSEEPAALQEQTLQNQLEILVMVPCAQIKNCLKIAFDSMVI